MQLYWWKQQQSREAFDKPAHAAPISTTQLETTMPSTTTLDVPERLDITAKLKEERARLSAQAGLVQLQHFKKPVERSFTADEREKVTILFGGLTWKHEKLIQAV